MTDKRKVRTPVEDRIKAMTYEEGDCLIWTGYTNNGVPMVRYYRPDGSRIASPVRRVLAERAGMYLNKNLICTPACGNRDCVKLEHIKLANHKHFMGRVAGINKTRAENPVRASRIAAAKRVGPGAKLDWDKVRRIREGGERTTVLAKELGVTTSVIKRVRNNQSWVDYTNPFTALLSR
jgi:hypothetical protein